MVKWVTEESGTKKGLKNSHNHMKMIAQLNTNFGICTLDILTMSYHGKSLFWSCLLEVLYVSFI